MKRGRAAALARRRALVFAMALAVVGSALAPAVPGWAGTARAQEGSGTIVHSADGVLLRAEPDFGAQVLETLPQGAQVGLRTYAADTVYDPDGVTQWWPVSSSSEEGWVAGFYLQIDGFGVQAAQPAADAPAPVEPTVDAGLGGETPAETAVEQFQATWDDLANAVAVVFRTGRRQPALRTERQQRRRAQPHLRHRGESANQRHRHGLHGRHPLVAGECRWSAGLGIRRLPAPGGSVAADIRRHVDRHQRLDRYLQ